MFISTSLPILSWLLSVSWAGESYGDTLIVAVATRHNSDLRDYNEYIHTQTSVGW